MPDRISVSGIEFVEFESVAGKINGKLFHAHGSVYSCVNRRGDSM